MTEPEQIRRHFTRGRDIVDADTRARRVLDVFASVDQGYFQDPVRAARRFRQARVQLNQTIGLARFDQADIIIFTVFATFGVAKEHRVTVLLRDLFDAANDLGEEWIGDVRHQHDDGIGALAAKIARQQVRLVATALDLCEHLFQGLFGNLVGRRQGTGHGGDRHAGLPGNLANRSGASGRHWVLVG